MDKMCGKASSLSETTSSLWETVSSIVSRCLGVAEGRERVTRRGGNPGPEFRKWGSHRYSMPGDGNRQERL
jgi:hypothetical protein